MSNLVERLRAGMKLDNGNPEIGRPPAVVVDGLHLEAANEIERLQKEVAFLRSHLGAITDGPSFQEIAKDLPRRSGEKV